MIFLIYNLNERGYFERRGAVTDAIEFNYDMYFCGVGSFTLTVPRNTRDADKIAVNSCLYKTRTDFQEITRPADLFIIKDIIEENDRLKITGYDMNGLLLDRLTLYPQDADKDIQSGWTSEIVYHYVDYNCISSPEAERNYPGLIIPQMLSLQMPGLIGTTQLGIPNDSASPRLACLADVVADILGSQKLGYRIRESPLKGEAGQDELELMFIVLPSIDRTKNQKEVEPVTLSLERGNVAEIQRETGITADKNTFYCELDSGAVQCYNKKYEEDTEASPAASYDRREEYLRLGCELPEMEIYAEHEIADRYRPTDSLTITAGNPLDFQSSYRLVTQVHPEDYGGGYFLGDIVTVYDRKHSAVLESIISAASIKQTATEYSVKITLGDAKPKLLDSYAKKNDANSAALRNAGVGVGQFSALDKTSEIFNGYTQNTAGVKGKSCFATARGFGTTATGYTATAEGQSTTASGDCSHAEGYRTTAEGKYSSAGGMNSTASGMAASAWGSGTTAGGDYSRAEGMSCSVGAGCTASTASGYMNKISDVSLYSDVSGQSNIISGGRSSCADGQGNNVTDSNNSHAGGMGNKLSSCSETEVSGNGNTVTSATTANVHGMNNNTTGGNSMSVFGMMNTTTGGTADFIAGMSNYVEQSSMCLIGGMSNNVQGENFSLAAGNGIKLRGGQGRAAFGSYNEDAEDIVFAVGGGKSDADRKNLIWVDTSGNLHIVGDIYINGKKN